MTDTVDVRGMRILVADDNEANTELLRTILEGARYRDVTSTNDPEDVPRLCLSADPPDLLVLDLHMPKLSGYEIMGRLRPVLTAPPYLPVLVVTADASEDAKRRALSLGASDFLTKPVDAVEVLLRTGNMLRAHRMRHHLNELVEQRTAEVEQARLETLACLAVAAEYRDDETGHHTQRVGNTARLVAERLGLAADLVTLIEGAATLHDIGKLGVADATLLKPGSLTDDEMATMREHVTIGAEILAAGGSPELRLAREIAFYHHERWDGSGYLAGAAGEDIPIAARNTAIADVFDALTHERPYKAAWPVGQATAEILSQRGRHFDPAVVDAFASLDHEALVEPANFISARRATGRVSGPPSPTRAIAGDGTPADGRSTFLQIM